MTADQTADTDETAGRAHLLAPELRRFPWLQAAVAGVCTFLAEYVAVAVLVILSPVPGPGSLFDQLTLYAFNLFGAHGVPVERVAKGFELDLPARLNVVLDASDPTIPVVVFLAIPVLGLLVAGATFEWWRPDTDEGLIEGSLLVGVGLATGYMLVGMLSAFLFVSSVSTQVTTLTESVDPFFAFAATLGYPLIVGSLGALLFRLRSD